MLKNTKGQILLSQSPEYLNKAILYVKTTPLCCMVLYTFEDTSMTRTKSITPAEYSAFQEAYDFFNTALFDGLLPDVLVTLQRQARSRGYFSPQRFRSRVEEALVHELALNPDCFRERTDEEICSTLAHEMVHVWQQTYGRAPRKAYHDRQWRPR